MKRVLWVTVAALGLLISVLYWVGAVPASWLYVLRSFLRLVGVIL